MTEPRLAAQELVNGIVRGFTVGESMLTPDEVVSAVMRELELAEDERLIRLGRQTAPRGIGVEAEDFDDEHYKRLGASVLSRIMQRARGRICGSPDIRTAARTLGDKQILGVVAPIADIVATFVSGPAIFTATASILAMSLDTYCKEYWKDAER